MTLTAFRGCGSLMTYLTMMRKANDLIKGNKIPDLRPVGGRFFLSVVIYVVKEKNQKLKLREK